MANIVEIIIKGKDATGGFGAPLKSFDDFTKKATRLAVGFSAGVSAAFIALTAKAINTADEMENMARKAQMPVETFSKLAHAATVFDTSLETLQIGLRFFNKSLSEAGTNAESIAGKAFTAMGIALRDSNGQLRATADVMLDVSNKFAGYKDGADKAKLAMDLFGRSGTDMLPLLNEGAENIKASMDEVNGVTQDTAANADEFGKNIVRLKAQFNELGITLATAVLPYLKSFTDWIIKAAKDEGTFNAIAMTTIDILRVFANGLASIYTLFQMVGIVMGTSLAVSFEIISKHVKTLIDLFKIWYEGLRKHLEIIGELIMSVADLAKVLEKLSKGNLSGAFEEGQKAANRFKEGLKGIAGNIGDTWKASGESVVKNYGAAFSNAKAIATQAIADIQSKAVALQNFFIGTYLPTAATGAALGGSPGTTPAPTTGGSIKTATDDEDKYFNSTAYGKAVEKALAAREEMKSKLMGMIDELNLAAMEPHQQEIARAWAEYDEKLAAMQALAADKDQMRMAEEAAQVALNARLEMIEQQKKESEKRVRNATVQGSIEMFGNMATAAAAFGKKGFAIAKAFSMAQAVMQTYQAANNALASPAPWPLPLVFAAAAVAAGMANVMSISQQKYGGAAHGGLDYVPAETTYLLQRGERVLSPNQNSELMQMMRGGGAGRMEVNVMLDGDVLAKGISEMSRDGRLWINARAIA